MRYICQIILMSVLLILQTMPTAIAQSFEPITPDNAFYVDRINNFGTFDFILAMAWSPDGEILASGGAGGYVMLEYVDSLSSIYGEPEEPIKLMQDGGRITSLAYSLDGLLAVASYDDTTIRLWDPDRQNVIRTLVGHSGEIGKLEFSPNGQLLASTSADNTIRLWDVELGEELTQFTLNHNPNFTDIAFTPDSNFFAFGNNNGSITLWDLQRNTVGSLQEHTATITGLIFTTHEEQDKFTLYSSSMDGTIRIWTIQYLSAEPSQIFASDEFSSALALNPDNTILVSANGTQLHFWDLETGLLLATHETADFYVVEIAFNSTGNFLAYRIWDGRNIAYGRLLAAIIIKEGF